MLVAFAVAERREYPHRGLFRHLLQRLAKQQVVDQRIGRQRQVMPMLLDRRRRQNDQCVLLRNRFHLLPRQVSKFAFSGDPCVHAYSLNGFVKRHHLARIQQSLRVILVLRE